LVFVTTSGLPFLPLPSLPIRQAGISGVVDWQLWYLVKLQLPEHYCMSTTNIQNDCPHLMTVPSRQKSEAQSGSCTVAIETIQISSQQPRRYFDPRKQTALADSIRQHGILEPLLVRPLNSVTSKLSTYELIAGERRYRAAKAVGLTEIPVIIREMSDTEALLVALIENLQREELNPIEETEGILQLLALALEKPKVEVISLLHRMHDESKGKVPHNVMGNVESQVVQQTFERIALMEWQSFVSNRLPLLKLPHNILATLKQGKITYTKAQTIARVKDVTQRQLLLEEAIDQDLTLTQIKEKVVAINTLNTAIDTPNQQSLSLKQQFADAYRRVRKSKVWNDPQHREKLEKLLSELYDLVAREDA
jgi:ParB family transcriptional regulator, chromosome partitioning protein